MEPIAGENIFCEVESWFKCEMGFKSPFTVRNFSGKHSEARAAFQGRPSKKSFAKLPRGTNARGYAMTLARGLSLVSVMSPYSYRFWQGYGQLNTGSVCFS